MKQFLKLTGMAVFGGLVSLAAYQFVKPAQNQVVEQQVVQQQLPVYQTASMNTGAPEVMTDFTVAAEKTLNAVVHVTNKLTVQDQPKNIWDLLYGNGQPRQAEGTGSGVVISPDGYIVTNNHVIEDADEIHITLNNKKKLKAELIGTDKTNDIALLKVEAERLDYITFGDSDNAQVGEWVLAVGNPYNLTSTVTAGIISAKGRDLEGNRDIESFIQTDAAVNPGNSGGALVNTRGELVGINTAITSPTKSYIGYSFAVPSNIAKKIVEDLMEHGNVQKALIGISYDKRENLEGVFITDVTIDGGAKQAGIQSGDIIKRINSVKIKNFSDLKGQLTAKRPGDIVDVLVDRNGKLMSFAVKLTEKKEIKINELGFAVTPVDKKELKPFDVKHGVRISHIENRELLQYGLKPGFILVNINGKPVDNADEVETLIAKAKQQQGFVRLEVITLSGEKEAYVFR